MSFTRVSWRAAEVARLELRSAFGTSHSSTTVRNNPRVHVTVAVGQSGATASYSGVAEIGMPPKKAGVYEADLADVAGTQARRQHVETCRCLGTCCITGLHSGWLLT